MQHVSDDVPADIRLVQSHVDFRQASQILIPETPIFHLEIALHEDVSFSSHGLFVSW